MRILRVVESQESRIAQIDGTVVSLAVDRVSAEVARELHAAGIESLLLKGPAILHRLYQPGDFRPYIDCDLLVPVASQLAAAAVLKRLGFQREAAYEDLDSGGAGQHDWHRDGDMVDLHGSLLGVRAHADKVWPVLTEHADTLIVGGYPMRVLSPAGLALVLALHVAAHTQAAVKPLEDLRRGLELFDEPIWDEAAEMAQRLDALPAFGLGLLRLPAGRQLVERLAIDMGHDTSVVLRASGAPPLAMSFERLRHAPTLGAKLRRVGRSVLPAPRFMRLWSPLARRGPLGLVLAYLWRPLWLVMEFGPGWRAWSVAREASDEPASHRRSPSES